MQHQLIKTHFKPFNFFVLFLKGKGGEGCSVFGNEQ